MDNEATGQKSVTSLDITDMVDEARKDAKERRGKVVTVKHGPGKFFIRSSNSRGHCYQQVCRHYYQSGKRKLEIAKLVWPSEKS